MACGLVGPGWTPRFEGLETVKVLLAGKLLPQVWCEPSVPSQPTTATGRWSPGGCEGGEELQPPDHLGLPDALWAMLKGASAPIQTLGC